MMKFRLQAAVALILTCAAAIGFASSRGKEDDRTMGFTLASTAFSHNGAIPSLHTCQGRDVSPPLSWTPPPAGTKSLG